MLNSSAQNSVHEAVEEYCKKYAISPAFEISEAYDLQADWTSKNYPFATEFGCYVFYTDDNKLSRLSNYFLRDTAHAIPRHAGWTSPPRFIQTIRVHEPFEAPSLEEFLIRRLEPSDNTAAMPRNIGE